MREYETLNNEQHIWNHKGLEVHCISTGSKGNCWAIVDIDGHITLLDCGITYKLLSTYFKDNGLSLGKIRLILITHEHGDHIKPTTLNKLHKMYPYIRVSMPQSTYSKFSDKLTDDDYRVYPSQSEEHHQLTVVDYFTPNVTVMGYYGEHSVQVIYYDLTFFDKEYDSYCRLGFSTDNKKVEYPEDVSFDIFITEANYCEDKLDWYYEDEQFSELSSHFIRRLTGSNAHNSKQSAMVTANKYTKFDGICIYGHQSAEMF